MAGALTKAGRYQIVSELGRGSMGVVYQAFDPVIGRTVAIKTMLTEGLGPAEFEEFKARFQREAQAAGVLTHPNIVTVYDFGEDSGILFLAMEFLEGKSLQTLVEEQGILPVETIIPMYEQVCSALDHAHIHKIVHRDIKPANIMILESGLVKLTDFGIAKMMTVGMTQAGQILGTPNYMSPEQVKGRQVDGRSDIFSLGVILYELVTGEKPFGGQNITTVIYKIINENPISPRELDATIPLGLSYSIQKALAKSPDERYQTCRELAEDLRNYKNLGGAAAPSATVIFRRPPTQTMRAEPAPPPAVQPARVQPTKAQAPAQAQAPAEPQLVRPLSVQVIHPPKPPAHGMSPVAWVLLALLVIGGLGGGYFFVHQRRGQEATQAPGTTTEPQGATSTTAQGETGATTTAGPGPTETTAAQDTAQTNPQPHEEQAPEASVPIVPGAGGGRSTAPPRVGQLVVRSSIPGARITIDGRSNPEWVTPYTIPDLTTGYHSVVVSKEGYRDAQRSVSIEGGRASTIDTVLTMPGGEISITTNPAGLEVVIDGRSFGRSPIQAEVGVGQHTYVIKCPEESYERSFTMKDDGLLSKTFTCGLMAAPASTGIVEVRTIPSGATVHADGRAVSGSTPTNFRLPAGRHTLTISLSGYLPLQKEVDVPPDGLVPVNERLARQ
jgi:predicted Ser/Thr protein kinase